MGSFKLIHFTANAGSLFILDAKLFAAAGLAQLDSRVRLPTVTVRVLPSRVIVIFGLRPTGTTMQMVRR